ncbi:MAG: phosphatidate cytidylyltransferase [Ruminococcus sp.]|nr:phosphatidate cytidylyltransferase [Ruminococcus sp.]
MRTRIISGAVGVVILAAVLVFDTTIVLPVAVAVIIAVMLFELLRAVELEKCKPIFVAVEFCGITMPYIYSKFYRTSFFDKADYDVAELLLNTGINAGTTVYAFSVTLIAAFIVFVTWLKMHRTIRYEQVFFALAVMILVPQSMSTIVRIDRMFPAGMGRFFLIMALCGAWIADTGAYFTGVALGKHKLCPEISPKKTIEGFVGGILTTGIVYAAAFSIYLGFSLKIMLITFIMGAVCAVVGTVGDLSASMVKRQIGFKDYGRIMPGHGGLMDRFDSVLFVLPAFYALLVNFFGVILMNYSMQ